MPLRKEKYILKCTVISAILNLSLNFLFIPAWGGNGAAFTTLLSELFVASYLYLLVNKENLILFDYKILFISLFGGGIVGCICFLLKTVFCNFLIYFGLSLICSSILYGIVQILGKNSIVMNLLPKIRNKFDYSFKIIFNIFIK